MKEKIKDKNTAAEKSNFSAVIDLVKEDKRLASELRSIAEQHEMIQALRNQTKGYNDKAWIRAMIFLRDGKDKPATAGYCALLETILCLPKPPNAGQPYFDCLKMATNISTIKSSSLSNFVGSEYLRFDATKVILLNHSIPDGAVKDHISFKGHEVLNKLFFEIVDNKPNNANLINPYVYDCIVEKLASRIGESTEPYKAELYQLHALAHTKNRDFLMIIISKAQKDGVSIEDKCLGAIASNRHLTDEERQTAFELCENPDVVVNPTPEMKNVFYTSAMDALYTDDLTSMPNVSEVINRTYEVISNLINSEMPEAMQMDFVMQYLQNKSTTAYIINRNIEQLLCYMLENSEYETVAEKLLENIPVDDSFFSEIAATIYTNESLKETQKKITEKIINHTSENKKAPPSGAPEILTNVFSQIHQGNLSKKTYEDAVMFAKASYLISCGGLTKENAGLLSEFVYTVGVSPNTPPEVLGVMKDYTFPALLRHTFNNSDIKDFDLHDVIQYNHYGNPRLKISPDATVPQLKKMREVCVKVQDILKQKEKNHPQPHKTQNSPLNTISTLIDKIDKAENNLMFHRNYDKELQDITEIIQGIHSRMPSQCECYDLMLEYDGKVREIIEERDKHFASMRETMPKNDER